MADGFLYAGDFPGFSWYHDLVKSKDRYSAILWNATPTFRTLVCNIAALSVLFPQKKDFDLEQKKATHRVALLFVCS